MHDDTIKGTMDGSNTGFNEDPYCYIDNLPEIPQIYIDDAITITNNQYGYLPADRENKTPVYDMQCKFHHSKFIADATQHFGWASATILRFDPNTVLDWHRDTPRQCALNFLIQDVDGMSHTFIREKIEGWNYNMREVKYTFGRPVLLNTSYEHTTYNFNPTKTRLVMSVTFMSFKYRVPVLYPEVKEWLLNYNTVDYN
jgi:hypothetical protein